MVDKVAVPNRLKQPIGKAEGENILRWLLAEKMVDPEDLIFGKHLVQLAVQLHGRLQIDAERLFHDDTRTRHQPCVSQQSHGGQGRRRWHA